MKRVLYVLALGCLVTLAALAPLRPAEAQVSSRRLVTVLASAQRTETTNSSDIINTGENLNVKGAYIFLDVSGVLTTPVITLSVQAVDPVAGTYRDIFVGTGGISATETYLIYPGIGSAANEVDAIVSYPLPASWRVSVEHEDTDPITYSVGALLVE